MYPGEYLCIAHESSYNNSSSYPLVTETVKGVTTVRHLMEPEEFKHQLMTFGDKMTAEEIDDIFGEFEFDDDGFIVTNSVVRN